MTDASSSAASSRHSGSPAVSKRSSSAATAAAAPVFGRERTPAQKRMTALHITAYPGILNYDHLPEVAKQATDFSAIDPLLSRKNHAVRNNNAGTNDAVADDNSLASRVPMLSETMMAAKISAMGRELHNDTVQHLAAHNGDASGLFKGSAFPRGYRTRNAAPPFDERSTYRAHYCKDEVDVAAQAAQRDAFLSTYREGWTATETRDVDAAKKRPYLSFPESLESGQSTVYRTDYMPEAESNEFRLLTHKTNLPELGTAFAYSAYAVGDPRRTIRVDRDVAALSEPRDFLCSSRAEKPSSATSTAASPTATATAGGRAAKEMTELQRMRALMSATAQRSAARKQRHLQDEEERLAAPVADVRRPADYIYLPKSCS